MWSPQGVERRGVQVGATRHGQTSAKDSQEWHDAHTAVCKSSAYGARGPQGRAHRESARSGDADDGEGVGEGAEEDNAVPRRRQLVRGLLLRLGRLGLLELGASLGHVLDLERAELVAPSKAAVVLQKGGGCLEHTRSTYVLLALWAE